MSEKIIYVVTSGDYSDYHIDGVFDSQELARLFVGAQKNSGDYTIEEHQVNPHEKPLRNGYQWFAIHMLKNGDTVFATPASPTDSDPRFWVHPGWTIEHSSLIPEEAEQEPMLMIIVAGRDLRHAVKIANERRTGLLVSGAWDEMAQEAMSRFEDWRGRYNSQIDMLRSKRGMPPYSP